MSDTVDLYLCMHNSLFKIQALLISDCHDQQNSVIIGGVHQYRFWYWSHLILWLFLLLPCLCFVLILIWNFIFQSELGGAAWWCRPPFSQMHWLWSSWSSSLSQILWCLGLSTVWLILGELKFDLCLYTKAAPVWKNILNKLWSSNVLTKGIRKKKRIFTVSLTVSVDPFFETLHNAQCVLCVQYDAPDSFMAL